MKRFIKFTLLVGVLVIIFYGAFGRKEKMDIQQSIANSLIRFHVRANSDTYQDQELKLKVKDAVLAFLNEQLEESQSLEDSRKILEDNMDKIKNLALEVIHNEGFDYQVSVYFEKAYFPMKTYGDITLPPGEYEAFRIDIGKVEGKNWWCVIYPPLCFVDATSGVLPKESKEELKSVLPEEVYDAITISNKDEIEYEVQFKYLKFLN